MNRRPPRPQRIFKTLPDLRGKLLLGPLGLSEAHQLQSSPVAVVTPAKLALTLRVSPRLLIVL